MKKVTYLLLINLLMLLAAANAYGDSRQQLIEIIDEELQEISRLTKHTGSRQPDLLLRMAELYLEKARVVKEQENDAYLQLSVQKRRKVSKKSYFKKSRHYFLKAQKLCNVILKKFKRYKKKSDVYFILAYKAKEFQQKREAKKYFQLAERHSRKNSPVNLSSKASLAELHFNAGEFRKAIPLYEKILKVKKDRWWTRDAYNLAWCYFRTKRHKQAIAKMNQVYSLSKQRRYVDMSRSVERDMAYFYTEMGKPQEAVKFYKKIGSDVPGNLLRVSKYLVTKGKMSAAERIINEALRLQTVDETAVKLNFELLKLYDKFGRVDKHLKIAGVLSNYNRDKKLNKEQYDSLIFQVKKMSAQLQKQVVGKTYRHDKRKRTEKAGLAYSYFKILEQLEPKTAHKTNFLIAETYYASGSYDKAVGYYDQAMKMSEKSKDKRTYNMSLNGIMASLGHDSVSKATKKKYLIPIYYAYLKKDNRSKKARTIYQRLFAAHYDKKAIKMAEKTLLDFKFNFPKSIKIQEAMLARVMDYYKDRGDRAGIKSWVARINRKEFFVSKKYARKLQLLLITMQFEEVNKASSRGDKKKALIGYVTIYRDPTSSKEAKKNAAYNIAVLFHELGDMKRTYGWAERALSLMNSKDVLKFQDSFLAITSEFFNRRQFKEAAHVNELVLNQICFKKSKNKKVFFKNANVIYLAEGNVDKSIDLIKNSFRCDLPYSTIEKAQLDVLKALIEQERWDSFSKYSTSLTRSKKLWPKLIKPLYRLYNEYLRLGRTKLARKIEGKILKFYNYCKKKKMNIPLEALDIIAEFKMKNLQRLVNNLNSIKLSFPEKRYNSRLKAKYASLDRLTTSAISILEIGSGEGIVQTYKVLSTNYRKMVEEIRGFTPKGKSKEYLKSFKASMVKFTAPILQKANEFEKQAKTQIVNSNILSKDNSYFLIKSKLPLMLEYQHPSAGVVMDRGGRK